MNKENGKWSKVAEAHALWRFVCVHEGGSVGWPYFSLPILFPLSRLFSLLLPHSPQTCFSIFLLDLWPIKHLTLPLAHLIPLWLKPFWIVSVLLDLPCLWTQNKALSLQHCNLLIALCLIHIKQCISSIRLTSAIQGQIKDTASQSQTVKNKLKMLYE